MVRIRTIVLLLLSTCRTPTIPSSSSPPQTSTVATPASVPPLHDEVEPALVLGGSFGCELHRDGTVWCWGNNLQGELGDDTQRPANQPRRVEGLASVVRITAGISSVAALTRDGRVFRWGRREEIPMRRDPQEALFSPRPEALQFDDQVDHIAIASAGFCVRLRRGDVVCLRHRERVGVEGLRGVSSLFVAGEKLCGLLPQGELRCVRRDLSPVTIAAQGPLRAAVAIGTDLIVQRTDGSVWRGQSNGNNSAIAWTAEVPVARGATKLWGSTFGWCFSRDQRLWCLDSWGDVFFQGHGVRGVEAGDLPVLAVRDPVAVAIGNRMACALSRDEAQPRCWGTTMLLSRRFGESSGSTDTASMNVVPMLPAGIPELVGATDLVAHNGITCALFSREPTRCWGLNNRGAALGGAVEWSLVAHARERSQRGHLGTTALSWHGRLACAVQEQNLHCWATVPFWWLRREVGAPERAFVPSLPAAPRAVTVGTQQVCTVLIDGRVACAPYTGFFPPESRSEDATSSTGTPSSPSALRDTSPAPHPTSESSSLTPPSFTVMPGLSEVTRLVEHQGMMCALSDRAPPRCWGRAHDWDIASPGDTVPATMPFLGTIRSLAYGEGHGCAVDQQGVAWCWGRGREGQLGSGLFSERGRPARVPLESPVEEIVAGSLHTCALGGGTVWCWGHNGKGQLGDGTTTLRSTPTRVQGLDSVTHLAAHGDTTCARTEDGRVWCWGDGEHGRLGDGRTQPRPTPTAVRGE